MALKLETWLAQHANVCNAIYWQKPLDGSGSGGTYPNWSAKRKALLQTAFERALLRKPTGAADPAPNLMPLPDNGSPVTMISTDDAWDIYVSFVAQSLAVETAGRVPWSLLGYGATSLKILFDSRQFFVAALPGYLLDFDTVGDALPCPADVAYRWVEDNDIVFQPTEGGSPNYRRATVGRAIAWCRDAMLHFAGGYTAKNMQDTWQYRGWTPVSRVISGTHNKADVNSFGHWTGGCHGTTGFLRVCLRTVNIPVQNTHVDGHSLPYFRTEKRWLSHGDDPYDRRDYWYPEYGEENAALPWPADDLLIGETTHKAWFGSAVSATTQSNNVSRRPAQLSLQRLPMYLLAAYCRDKQAGKTHGKGEVFGFVQPAYSLKALEDFDLWTKLEAKLQSLGGCGQIP
jgi:hypothetical protein